MKIVRFLGVTFQSRLLRRQILSLSMYPLQRHLELPVPVPAEILRIKLPDAFSL